MLLYSFVSADRRATARTTTSLSHAAIRQKKATVFALKRTSLGSVLDCVALCLEESLLSLAKLRLEEVWKSFTEHTKRVDVWLKNDSEKGP